MRSTFSKKYNPFVCSLIICTFVLFGCTRSDGNQSSPDKDRGTEKNSGFHISITPESYVCYRTNAPLVIDGEIDEVGWDKADWTNPFMDIEGNLKNQPKQQTHVKMLWDENYLYVTAMLEEKHVWATLRQRDTVIFYDNDFEIFIDPDGDTHQYYELEVNALGTVWDLLMAKPYRDGGPAISGWDISGLKVGVKVKGTINDPESDDEHWIVEIAMPWKVLKECAPGRRKPKDGDQWRVNFTRVDWEIDVIDGKYLKRKDPDSGRILPPVNWVWSPQERVDMHAPETWGYVQFSEKSVGEEDIPFIPNKDEELKWVLRKLYQLQRTHLEMKGEFAASLEQLGLNQKDFSSYPTLPLFSTTASMYEISLKGYSEETWRINNKGKVWKTK